MRFRAMAKHFQFERGRTGTPMREDGTWLGGANRKPLTDNQLGKLEEALGELRAKQHEQLVKQKIVKES